MSMHVIAPCGVMGGWQPACRHLSPSRPRSHFSAYSSAATSVASRPTESWLDLRAGGGLRHRLLQWGKDSDRLVLFFHANSVGPGPWGPVVRRIPDIHAVAVELRGHGDSDAPQGHINYRWDLFAADFRQIISATVQRFGKEPYAVVTHSFSGDCALLALAEQPPLPVERLIMLDPVLADADGAAAGAERLAKGTRRLGEREAAGWNSAAALCTSIGRVLSRATARDCLDSEAMAAFAMYAAAPDVNGVWRLKCRRETEAAIYANRICLSHELKAKRVDADVQLVFAGYRRTTSHENQTFAFARDLHEAECVVARCREGCSAVRHIPGVGHFLVLEAPGLVADTLSDMLV